MIIYNNITSIQNQIKSVRETTKISTVGEIAVYQAKKKEKKSGI